MTSLLSARKRAEEFAAAVDGGAEPASLSPELAELLGVVGTLQREGATGEPVTLRPDFAAELRERLMAEAETTFAGDNILTLPPRRKGSRERRIAMLASSLVIVGGSAGMAAAAQSALPGEALYPIKRGLENAQAGLATSQGAKGKDLLAQADNRLVEVRELLDRSADLSQVPSTLEAFNRQAGEAADVLIEEFEDGRDPALIEELRTFTADGVDELQELAKTAPPAHQEDLALAAETLLQIDARAKAICPDCGDGLRSLEMPALFLTANEARVALDAVDRVQLDNSHPVITEESTSKSGGGQGPSPSDDQEPKPGKDRGDGGATGDEEDPDLPDVPPGGVDANAPDTGDDGLDELVDGATGGVLGEESPSGTGGGKSGGDKGKGSGSGDKAKEMLPEELDAVVDTLLP